MTCRASSAIGASAVAAGKGGQALMGMMGGESQNECSMSKAITSGI